jgi:5-carboxymethyl-2-hydroxymuconic-semialdehyde dehydrogenase
VVPETVSHLIGGKHVHSTLRKTYGVTDPATGKEYAQVEVGLGADINQAVLAARTALETGPWPGLPAAERAGVLSGIADAIDARAGDIAAAEALGPGLPVTQAREQAARAGDIFRLAAELVSEKARPAGVAGLITSWRSPFLSQARAVAPALAAGCSIVLKPDEWAPMPAVLLEEITTAAGLPDGVLNIVHGSLHRKALGAQARDAMISHPSVARLWFAGEAADAEQVTLQAGTHAKVLSAELVGPSPGLVFADADLDQALDGALFGAFAINGHRRTATSKILVERPVYDAFVSRFAQRAGRIRVGDPADPETELGPLPHADQYGKLDAYIRLGRREGARLAAGGGRPASLPEGSFLAPTVLANVTPEMEIFTGVTCGPVARVTPFDTDEEAISLANTVANTVANTGPALTAAYIWTTDLQRARRLAPAIESAATWVNSHNPLDLAAESAGRAAADAAAAGIDFFTDSRTLIIAADGTPVPRFGA